MKIEWLIIFISLLVLLLYDSNGELMAPLERQIREKCVGFCKSSLIALPNMDDKLSFGNCSWSCRVEQCSNGCSLFSMDSKFNCDKDCPVSNRVCKTGCRTAESMYMYQVQALLEKCHAVIDRNSSQKIVLAWRLEPYDLSTLLFTNNRDQTNSLLLRVEIKRPNEPLYDLLNRNIGISPSLVTADLPTDEFVAGIYETRLTISYKQRRVTTSKPVTFEVPGSVDLASVQLKISTVQCMEPGRALICWNVKMDKLLRVSLLREDMTLIREDSTNEPCFLFTSLTSNDNYVVQISVSDGNQQILLAKESLFCKFSSSFDLRPTLFYADKNQIYKMADVNDYHQSSIVVHDQEKFDITAFAVSRINKSDIFFIATNNSQITVKQEYKILATERFTGDAIRSIMVDQHETKYFFIQTEYEIFSANTVDSDIEFRRIFKSKHAIKSAVLDTFTCHIYISTMERVQSITLTTPVIAQNLKQSLLSNCSLTIDLFNRQLLCQNGRIELFYYDLVSGTISLEKSNRLKADAAKNYANLQKMTAFNGSTFWSSSGHQCSRKNVDSCLMTDEFNPKTGFYVVNEYFLQEGTNAELLDVALYVENMPTNLFPPTETTVFNNGSRISSWASNQSPLYFKAAQNCLDSTLKTILLSIDDQNRTTKIVQQSTDSNFSAASITTFFDMNPNFKDLNHTLMISNSVCKNGQCSKTSNSTFFRMLDLNWQELDSIYLREKNSVIKVNILGEAEQVWDQLPQIRSMFCGNVSCFTVHDNGRVIELKAGSTTTVQNFPHAQTPSSGIKYDSSTKKLYWFNRDGIYHANFDNPNNYGLLAVIADVKSINPVPHEPIIVVCTGSQVFAILKTGGYYRQYFTCNSYYCEVQSCTIRKSQINNELLIIYAYEQDNRTLLITQNMNNDYMPDRMELDVSTKILQIEAVTETLFMIRDDKYRFGTFDAKLNATNWFFFEDISDFCFSTKGSLEKFTSSIVKAVNITRSIHGLNISWIVGPLVNESDLFDISSQEPIFNGLYHAVTNDTFLIIDEPSDQQLSINITILNDYQSSKVQQFTLLVDEVAHYANLSAFSLTPNCISLIWTAYKTRDTASIIYSTNLTDNDSTVISLKENSSAKCQDTVCSKIVCHKFIKPGAAYHCKIVGKTQQGVRKFETPTVGLTMTNLPGSFVAVDRTINSLTLNWTFFVNSDPKPDNLGFFYKKISDQKWRSLSLPDYQPLLQNYSTTIKNLTSDAQYSLKYSANYHVAYQYGERFFKFDQIFEWTTTAATLAEIFVMSKMINVEIVQKLDGNFTLQWRLSDPKVPVTQFIVMYRKNETSNWTSLVPPLPPTVTSVVVPKKLQSLGVQFNIFLNSSKGYGPDNLVNWPEISAEQQTSYGDSKSNTYIVLTCILMVLILSTIGGFLVVQRIRKKRRKMEESFPKITVAFTNRSYGGSPDDDQIPTSKRGVNEQDLSSLPHVPRSCVTISRLLGSGAFGEVFEGLAYNLPKTGRKTCRVAIKSLRLNHQSSEKIKFLHEALLMSSMDHRNIVSLLGVCIGREPQWLILDLMEGGDLLSFLRSSRPTTSMPSHLCLNDLLQMSHDVACGCAYLEKERHVHRDLAARNCLLSSRDPELRIIKIGDFGMSRDVYEGDYYRVEGEGLMPVRWMAPESLIDGVFTVKTDVWSFGILLWEIMSLGQQPYIGKSNFETMNFVRLGGRLEPPEACPQDVYHAMIQCWDSLPTNRKSFAKICDEISDMKSKVKETVLGEQPFPPNFPDQSHRSLRRSGREKISKIFSSLRRKSEQPHTPVLPSKDVFDKQNESRRSDSAMSFTTTATGYEVALLKRNNDAVKVAFDHFTNDGVDNYGYCSSASSTVYGPEKKKDDKPVPKMLVTEI